MRAAEQDLERIELVAVLGDERLEVAHDAARRLGRLLRVAGLRTVSTLVVSIVCS